MHYSQYSGDLKSFTEELDNLTLEKAKELLIKLWLDNKNLRIIATKASSTVEQYKALISLMDGVHYEENLDNKIKHKYQICIQLVNLLNNFAFWILMLIQNETAFSYCDEDFKDICELMKALCINICNDCDKAKISHYAFKSRRIMDKNGLYVRNLEKSRKGSKKLQRLDSNQNSENRDDKNRNLMQNDGAKYNKKQEKSTLELSKSTHGNEKKEEKENGCVANQETCDQPEQKREKLFEISYLKQKNLLNKDRVENNNVCQKTAIKSDENSSVLDQSSKACENDINEGKNNSLPRVTSKRSHGYKRRHMLDSCENHVNEGKNVESRSRTSVAKKPCISRKNHLRNMHGNDKNVNALDEDKVNTLDTFVASQRSCRSNKNRCSNADGRDKIECISNSNRKHFKKGNSFVTSETKAEDVASCGKLKRNKKGKRKKENLMQQEVKENFKSSDLDENKISFEFDHNSDSSSLKSKMTDPYVLLKNVLYDPNAQHYHDIIRYNEKKKTGSNVVICKEKSEMEETFFNKEGNEIQASQELDVLDVASDEKYKESDNIESIGGQCSNNDDRQESDSEVYGEESMNDVSGEQSENDSTNREQLDDSVNREGHNNERSYFSGYYDNNNNNNSDSETRMYEYGPRTPPFYLNPDFGNCSEDYNNADASRNVGEDTYRVVSDPIYGKRGPRTPPSPAPFDSPRRGPHTPPGLGPDSEVMDDEDFESSSD